MAVPSMSNNTPLPGRITWGAFTIQYMGGTFSIPSGSTDKRWVWWKYNGGVGTTIAAGDDIPTTLTDDDLLLFGNKNGIGVRVQSTSTIDGELLVDGSIFSNALSTNLINSQHIVTAGLDAGVIKFGTMHGDRIEANSLTIGKVDGLQGELDEKATEDYVQSRGTNLIANGSGLLGDNTNFSSFSFDATDLPVGASGAFLTTPGSAGTPSVDELLPVDPNKPLQLSFQIKQKGTATDAVFYGMVIPYDAYKNQITPQSNTYESNTLTELAADLKPGDTTVQLVSAANWWGTSTKPSGATTYRRSLIWWDYVDPGGKLWPVLTYSRNYNTNVYDDGAVVGNTITLRSPWAGPLKPAGTKLSNGSSGGTYMYMRNAANTVIPAEWTKFSDTIVGIKDNGGTAQFSTGWPHGTSYARVAWLKNRSPASPFNDPNSQMSLALVSFGDTGAAQESADKAFTRWAPASQTTIDGNKITANTIIGSHIVGNTITGNKMAANTITGDKIAANTITGDKVVANTIGAGKLVVADVTSLVSDGMFADPYLTDWNMSVPSISTNTVVKSAGEAPYLKIVALGTNIFFVDNNKTSSVSVGDEIYVSYEFSTPTTNTANFTEFGTITYIKATGSTFTPPPSSTVYSPGQDWTKVERTFVVEDPELIAVKFNWIIYGGGVNQEIRIRNVVMKKRLAGELIVDGGIVAKNISSGAIEADHISAGAITGELLVGNMVMGSTIRTGEIDENGQISGPHIELGPNGFFTKDSDGNTVISLPNSSAEDARVVAHVDMLSAEVRDNFTMHGTNNSIASDGELTLSAGANAPSNPPDVQEVWDTVQLDTSTVVAPHVSNPGYDLGSFAINPTQIASLDWDDEWLCWVVLQQRSDGFRIWRYQPDGTLYNNLGSGTPWVDDYNGRTNCSIAVNTTHGGVTHLSKLGTKWYIWGKTPTGTDVINEIPSNWIKDTKPNLSFNAVDNTYVIIQNTGFNGIFTEVTNFTLKTGTGFPTATLVGSRVEFEFASGRMNRINGAVYGAQLTGSGNNWAVSNDGLQTVRTFSPTGIEHNNAGSSYYNWIKPSPSLGFCHDGNRFASVESDGRITFYENWSLSQNPLTIYIGASAYDSDVNGDQANPHAGQTAGQHETPVGVFASLQPKRRSKIQISMPETNDSGFPDDPDKWKLYWYTGTATPTDKAQLKHIATIGSPTSPTSHTLTATPTGAAPPGGIQGQPSALNNFPVSNPARVESSVSDSSGPLVSLSGDGSGRVGPLSWGANGQIETSPLPVGTVIDFAGSTLPAGFMACNGQALSTTTYPELFSALGYTWGGFGTTFNLPDLRRRFTWGVGTGVALGYTDGVVDDSGRNPQHSHTISPQNIGDVLTAGSGSGQGNIARYQQVNNHNHGGNTGSASIPGSSVSSQAFPNAALNKIIKVV